MMTRTRATKTKSVRINVLDYRDAITAKCNNLTVAATLMGRNPDFLRKLFRENKVQIKQFYLDEIKNKLGVDYEPYRRKNNCTGGRDEAEENQITLDDLSTCEESHEISVNDRIRENLHIIADCIADIISVSMEVK